MYTDWTFQRILKFVFPVWIIAMMIFLAIEVRSMREEEQNDAGLPHTDTPLFHEAEGGNK